MLRSSLASPSDTGTLIDAAAFRRRVEQLLVYDWAHAAEHRSASAWSDAGRTCLTLARLLIFPCMDDLADDMLVLHAVARTHGIRCAETGRF